MKQRNVSRSAVALVAGVACFGLVACSSDSDGGGSGEIGQELIFAARKEVNAIHVAEAAEKYIVDLVIGTREPKRHGGDLARWIRLGASPRATLALDAAARAHAWLQGQDFVSPDNIRAVAPACLAHRVHLSYEAEAAGRTRNDVIEALLKAVVSV